MRGVDTAARYGGEEFALILPRTDMVSAYNVGERIRAAIAELRITVDTDAALALRVTASFGIASYPESKARDGEDLVRRADRALYRAKQTGKNRVELFWGDDSGVVRRPTTEGGDAGAVARAAREAEHGERVEHGAPLEHGERVEHGPPLEHGERVEHGAQLEHGERAPHGERIVHPEDGP
jgi:predicted signal transduction protein with EAL and GGDEF domain